MDRPDFHSLEDGLKNPTDEGDYTPLHFAAEAGHLTIAKYIVECVSPKKMIHSNVNKKS